ncbi:type I restriction-modification system subunit M [Chryseolinea sp. H1M3-3]|uniref:type I restriction-modification system subunit M n=1 Tax=Chryseolinea sp. H1M3-3 TaxID=3034144 RepID=UPI0023EC63F1|nr:type I restriction-modification system subunit M [Chryseolinea sp. H1M3-3]
MAIKKSELYSHIWAGCDALRGGMDPSTYKDYVLTLLFVKYVSDKYAGKADALIEIPKGGGFKDMAELKGKKEIGDGFNKIIGKLAHANDLKGVIDVADFNDEDKLGKGKEMIDKLTDLISIFENPALDFSKNRASGDDILGDAYEYLMMHFATESGKSKGQFYTPAEVSRVIAKVIGINNATKRSQTIYDPTCGSGSLLLKAVDEAEHAVTIYGQEKDVATAALARMNMILHNHPTAEITKGQSTLSNPLFEDKDGNLKTFDFVVANPPFSLVNWSNGFNPSDDLYDRFTGYGIPPEKNGDYAFLLHIVRSLKSTGKGACILPHGVLFRGGAEGQIRKNLIEKKYIKGIIGLPTNLFYGTGIPACIIVVDKENSEKREGIFMIDGSKGFMKDGNKNRLREQDIHKIVDVFNKQLEIPKYSRLVKFKEISDEKNYYNLNIPRYIDSQEPEDIQDIDAHLNGDIPNADIEALEKYWKVYPTLKNDLFSKGKRAQYFMLKVPADQINTTIFNHKEFVSFSKLMDDVFADWKKKTSKLLKDIKPGVKPKQVIFQISEDILKAYTDKDLLDKYDIYQHLMNYWNETMQDDVYLIAVDGWKAEPYRILVKNKQGKDIDKGWTCDLVPPQLVIDRFFAKEKQAIETFETYREAAAAEIEALVEEHSGEEGYFATIEKVNKASVQKRMKELEKAEDKTEYKIAAEPKVKYKAKAEAEVEELETELDVLRKYLDLTETESKAKMKLSETTADLDMKVIARYKTLSENEIKTLVVDDKWMAVIEKDIKSEMERVSQALTQRIKELAERYETPLPKLSYEVGEMEEKVKIHLKKMGFVWG